MLNPRARESMINEFNDLPFSKSERQINEINDGNFPFSKVEPPKPDPPRRLHRGWTPTYLHNIESIMLAVQARLPQIEESWLMTHLQIEIGMAVKRGWIHKGDTRTPLRAAMWATHNASKQKPQNLYGYFRATFRDFLASEGKTQGDF
jgi:hypothetical protein